MASRKPLLDDDGELREITAEDVALFKPFSTLPREEQKVLSNLRRCSPQKAPKKVRVSIRLSPDVVENLRATGNGWQVRADEAPRFWLSERKSVKTSRRAQSS